MVCLPGKDPNQFDLFDENINFPAEPSTAFPPNMQDIMDELAKPDAFAPSPNLQVVDDALSLLAGMSPAQIAALAPESQQVIAGSYNYSGDPSFDPYTNNYNAAFPPLVQSGDTLQDMLNLARTHLLGIQGLVPGALGSMGQANTLSTLGYMSAGNVLQRSLGLGAIADCGLMDQLLGLLKQLLQPLIDLLAGLLTPLFNLLADLLGILAAILAELLNLLNLLQQLLNFGNAGRLLNADPCALLYMAQNGSPSLNTAVNNGIIWRNPNAPRIPQPGEFSPSF